MIKKILAASVIAMLAVSPAVAGNASMKSADGTKLRINCTGSGCKVTAKKPGGKWGTVEKTAGGSENYEKLEAKYKGKGFK